MKKFLTLIFLGFLLGTVMGEENHHHHHELKSLSLNNGKKWEVDQTMKENMEAINSELKKTKELASSKKITAKNYADLGNIISTSAQKIASNCKMEEKADETFHVVLGDLMAVAEDFKDAKKAKHATLKLTHALKVYTEYFDQTFAK